MANKEIQIKESTLFRSLLDFPILMDWFDDFVPFSFSLRSEETHPIKIEEFVKDNEIVIRAELPGVDPDKDIEVTVGDGKLTIKGERREEHKGAEKSDFHYGSFIRSISLPSGTEEKNVRATYKNGILEVKLEFSPPKSNMKKVKVESAKK